MMQFTLNRKSVFILVCSLTFYFIYLVSRVNRPLVRNTLQGTNIESRFMRNWIDTELISRDEARHGLGERGEEVYLTDTYAVSMNEKLYQETGFSVLVSDKISVNRSLPAMVHPHCMKKEYDADLPIVSVIIIFHNEVQSVLLRTVHSVFNRTPPQLLHEIILVNDNSSRSDLYEPLRSYVKKTFSQKVKIINLKKRSGLIVTRMEGARAATGEVLVFFDSHVEVHFNWLPPLLQPIVDNKRIATLPVIDYLNPFTFGYVIEGQSSQGARGVIDWYLDYHELPKLPADAESNLKPFPNPIMLGCAFAIDRRFFIDELGGYDEGLQIWNGENYELSFKLWMCADGLFTVPCSRVAHSFRNINPSRVKKEDYVAKNFMRIAEVWLDEFKDLPRQLEPERYRNVDPGDLSHQKALRRDLNCKSFRWFLTHVAPDMLNFYPPVVVSPSFAYGSVQSAANPRLCLDNMGQLNGEKLGLVECSQDSCNPGTNQKFIYSFFKDIRQDHGRHEYCLDSWDLRMTDCNQVPYGNQFWIYKRETKEIWIENPDRKCLTIQLVNETLTLDRCNNDMTQKWQFGFINHDAFDNFNDIFGYSSILDL